MILFTPEMAQAIVEGCKTVTRRRWKKPRVRVGALHLLYTRPAFARPPGKPFARVRIVNVWPEDYVGQVVYDAPSLSISGPPVRPEANREGFGLWREFCAAYEKINGKGSLKEPCVRVEFELVEVLGEVSGD